MDKITRDRDGIVALEDVPAKLDEIIDWINAREASIVDMIKDDKPCSGAGPACYMGL